MGQDFKYFIGHVNCSNDDIKPWRFKLFQLNVYLKRFEKLKYMPFAIDGKKKSNKYSEIREKLNNFLEATLMLK